MAFDIPGHVVLLLRCCLTRMDTWVPRIRVYGVQRDATDHLDEACMRVEPLLLQSMASWAGQHVCGSNSLQASEAKVASLNSELGVTRDELARASAVASRATAAEAKLVKGDGMVPAGGAAGEYRVMLFLLY